MNERSTIEVILPDSKDKVILYSFLTNGDFRAIQKILLSDVVMGSDELNENAGKSLKLKLTGSKALDYQEKALRYLVKSVTLADGTDVTDIDAYLYYLTIDDGNFLYTKANELTAVSKLSDDAKKK